MAQQDETILRASGEANDIFERMAKVVEEKVKQRAKEVNVLEIARGSGLELDERSLAELQIPPLIPIHPFLPWHVWFPWRPLWCWWWHGRYPWYRCCPYWWYRCHWYPW
jgi:hypothetical protein